MTAIDYTNPNFLEVALKCLDWGWYIFPLEYKRKTPNLTLCPHWSQDSTNDPEKVKQWWGDDGDPSSNIGIDLGKSGLVVLDFDSGEAPPNLNLPATLRIRTGKGEHVYFRGTYPQQDILFGGKHCGEVKAGGGYVVGPRSLHPSGAVYEPIDQSNIAPLPLDIVTKLTNKPYEPVDASPSGAKIPYGKHDTELHRIAGKLRGIGMEETAIYNALVEICEKRCENYGTDYLEMCRKHASKIAEKPVNQPTDINLNQPTGVQTFTQAQQPDVENWRDYFRSIGQLPDGDVRMLIGDANDGFLPEGITFIGALSGHGKTLLALSLVKSLTTGERFLGRWQPQDIIPCLYLTPESSGRAFKMRCRAFRIPDDPNLFLCRTVSEGMTLLLSDPILKKAIETMKPVVFLDTMIRFNKSADENAASANQQIADDMIALRGMGAIAIVGLHHSTKASANEELSLENCLRGTGDFSAVCDSVYAIRRDRQLYDDGNGPNEIDVKCVKPKDIKKPPKPFRLAATYKKDDGTIISYVDETGDFHFVELAAVLLEQNNTFFKIVTEDPTISAEKLAAEMGMPIRKLRSIAKNLDYVRVKGRFGRWIPKSELTKPILSVDAIASKTVNIDTPTTDAKEKEDDL
jgi:hypothetical protein